MTNNIFYHIQKQQHVYAIDQCEMQLKELRDASFQSALAGLWHLLESSIYTGYSAYIFHSYV